MSEPEEEMYGQGRTMKKMNEQMKGFAPISILFAVFMIAIVAASLYFYFMSAH